MYTDILGVGLFITDMYMPLVGPPQDGCAIRINYLFTH